MTKEEFDATLLIAGTPAPGRQASEADSKAAWRAALRQSATSFGQRLSRRLEDTLVDRLYEYQKAQDAKVAKA